MKIFYLLTLSFIIGCAQKKADDTITLIPKGYTGPFVIILNQKNGEQKVYEDGKRLYKIPENGVLITKFEAEFGVQTNRYYYVDNSGIREEIKWLNIYDRTIDTTKTKENTFVFLEEHLGKGSGFDEKGIYNTSPMISCYIGEYNDLEKKANEQMKFIFKNQRKEDE